MCNHIEYTCTYIMKLIYIYTYNDKYHIPLYIQQTPLISNSDISNPRLSRTNLRVPTNFTYISLITLAYLELFLSRTHFNPNKLTIFVFKPTYSIQYVCVKHHKNINGKQVLSCGLLLLINVHNATPLTPADMSTFQYLLNFTLKLSPVYFIRCGFVPQQSRIQIALVYTHPTFIDARNIKESKIPDPPPFSIPPAFVAIIQSNQH